MHQHCSPDANPGTACPGNGQDLDLSPELKRDTADKTDLGHKDVCQDQVDMLPFGRLQSFECLPAIASQCHCKPVRQMRFRARQRYFGVKKDASCSHLGNCSAEEGPLSLSE